MQKNFSGSNSFQFLVGVCLLLSSSAISAPAPTSVKKARKAHTPTERKSAPVPPVIKTKPAATTAKPTPAPAPAIPTPPATPVAIGTPITYGMKIKIFSNKSSGGIWTVTSAASKTGQIQHGDVVYLINELNAKDPSSQREKDQLSVEIQGGGSLHTNSSVGFMKKKKDHNAYLAIVSATRRKFDDQNTITINHIKFNNKPFYWKAAPQAP